MIYVIAGEEKDIQEGDVIELPLGLYEYKGEPMTAVVAVDVSNPEIIGVAALDFETKELLDTFTLSPSWIENIWRTV